MIDQRGATKAFILRKLSQQARVLNQRVRGDMRVLGRGASYNLLDVIFNICKQKIINQYKYKVSRYGELPVELSLYVKL